MWRFLAFFFLILPAISYSSTKTINEIAYETYLYAMMSANSYHKGGNCPWNLPANIREVQNSEIICDICKIRKNRDESDTGVFNMKKGAQAKVFEIFDKDNNVKKVVIAFRGTQAWYDWLFGNVRKTHRRKAVSFYDAVQKHYPNLKITVTGHSLGGAMSLQVSSERGADTYIFNPSYRVKNSNPYEAKRVQVEENGDVLAIQRYLWKNPEDVEKYKLTCSEKNDHSISQLAGCLIEMAAAISDDAKRTCKINHLPKCK